MLLHFEHAFYYVYLIRELGSDGFFKIGITNNLKQRISTIQTGNPRKVEYVDTIKCWSQSQAREIEAFLHGVLNNARANGEWFLDNVNDVSIVDVFTQMKQIVTEE